MAEKQVWLGSVGPFIFDDDEEYLDPEDDDYVAGDTIQGVKTDGEAHADLFVGSLEGYYEGLRRSFLL